MARPYFSVKHVESMDSLPEKLTPGRIYFVDDEQSIVIDHGNGLPPVIYGGKPGPMGPAGEPQPHLQEQIDTLAQTELAMQKLIWDEGKKFRENLTRTADNLAETLDRVQDMANTNAQTLMSLSRTIKESFDSYDAAIATLSKAVTNLYPDHIWHGDDDGQSETPSPQTNTLAQTLNVGDNVNFSGEKLLVNKYTVNADGSFSVGLQSQGEFSDDSDPLDNETISTDAGSWTIQQSNMHDGSTVYDLTAQHSVPDTLAEGDTITTGTDSYTVSSMTRNDDGSVTVSLS